MRLLSAYLEPAERLVEVVCGLVMVLTFTLTAGLSVSDGPAGVRTLLTAAVGCNVAWGIIDGVTHVMARLVARGPQSRIEARDLLGAFEIFAIDVLCTLPAVVPFLVLDEPMLALRWSNALLMLGLFAAGYVWAGLAGRHRVWSGLALALIGGGLVALAIALGG
jgi:hypothetical protein